jgi:hypothetical protein
MLSFNNNKLNKLTFKTNIALVRHLVASGKLTRYCYFVKFKAHFSNSLYYNYRAGNLAKIHGHGNRTTRQQIDFFLKHNWCWIDRGHLKFRSLTEIIQIEKLDARSFTKTNIDVTNIKAAKLQLQKLLFEDHLRKQEYVIRQKNNLRDPKNLKDHKSALRWRRKSTTPGERSSHLCATLAGMSNLFNCSLTTANRIKQKFRSQGWYEFFKQFTIVARNVTIAAFNRGIRPQYGLSTFLRNGIAYRSEPSRVIRVQSLNKLG